ncbi:hypothetical protein HDU87_008196 [Geranomyces variabilis]|uniref:Elongation of fatty acids protein n=1 Tax=Geranomyces variabilis TaxID=109894 RepID=A0AAD5TD64_9FUNG|nr:hypothetical protein HDU87_008196 [Geranomyces variabilis]
MTFHNATSTLLSEPSLPLGFSHETLLGHHFPLSFAVLYFITVKSLAARNVKPPVGRHWTQAGWFTALVVAHNAFLAIFSAVTFIGASKGVMNSYGGRGFKEAYCDRDEQLWNSSLGYYAFYFYLSKYYEVIDTAIILLKGRKPSLLQSYHHAGAIISMWLCVRSHATGTWIFVVFNSFIHTLMYSYYVFTTVGIRPPTYLKKTLTRMQITQFCIGGALAAAYPLIPGCLKMDPARLWEEKGAYVFVLSYLGPLVLLFVNFARRTYAAKMKKA